jgi:hypothetical protein
MEQGSKNIEDYSVFSVQRSVFSVQCSVFSFISPSFPREGQQRTGTTYCLYGRRERGPTEPERGGGGGEVKVVSYKPPMGLPRQVVCTLCRERRKTRELKRTGFCPEPAVLEYENSSC